MNTPGASTAKDLRRWTVGGALTGAALLFAALVALVLTLAARPALDVRRVPLVLHGGAPTLAGSGEPARWRQAIAPLAAPVSTLALRVADLVGLPPRPDAPGALRLRYAVAGGWSEWLDAHDLVYVPVAGQEGRLEARLGTVVPAGVALEVELAAGVGAPGAKGTLSPFLRYRGPVRPLTPAPNRQWVGREFERAAVAESNGLVPMTGLALAVGAVDLAGGPLEVAVRREGEAEWLARGTLALGAVARGGHVCVPLDTPLSLGRVAPLVVRVTLPVEGALLGDDVGPSVHALFGAPGPRPELRELTLGRADTSAPLLAQDLALRLGGPLSLTRGIGAVFGELGPRHLLAAALFVLVAALAGRAGAAVRGAQPRAAGTGRAGTLASAASSARAASPPTTPFVSAPLTSASQFSASAAEASSADALAAARSALARRARAGSAPWRRRALGALAGAFVLTLALGLRAAALDSGAMSPDDGEYLRSARVESITGGGGLGQALAEDREWVALLAEDFSRYPERTTYPHGYLHQLAIRWAVRLGQPHGVGYVTALRADQALLGALTALLVFLWLRRAVPGELAVALAGGSLVATQLVHVHLSRTGWGAAGCTAFLVAMAALGWRMQALAQRQRLQLGLHAAAIAVCSLLAYGFHEMAVVYVAAFAVIATLEFSVDDGGRRVRPWRSARTWFGLAACVPVGTLTLGLLLGSEYAREVWFKGDLDGRPWLETRKLAWIYFREVALATQVGWPVLGLAAIGAVGAVLRDARYARWLVLWCVLPSAVLFLRFNYPHLPRIYLPTFVLLCLFAAEGLGVLLALARTPLARAAAAAVGVGAVAFGAATVWQTLHAPASAPLHVSGVHQPGRALAEPRRPLTPILEALGPPSAAPGRVVGVRSDRLDPYYRMLDAGQPVEVFDPRWPLERWPAWVIGNQRLMKLEGRDQGSGGPYRLVTLDRRGGLGLYVRE